MLALTSPPASLEEQLHDGGVVAGRGKHERRAARHAVAGRRGEVDVRAAAEQGAGHLHEAELARQAERRLAQAVHGVGGCEGMSVDARRGGLVRRNSPGR